jgi:hypothetical protein
MTVGFSEAAVGRAEVPATETFNGTAWTLRHPPKVGDNGELSGASCRSADDCTVVGASINRGGNRYTPTAEHWDGHAWRIEPTVSPPGGGSLLSVSCPTSSTCIAVGETDDGTVFTERWHSGGVRWSILGAPAPGGIAELSDVSCSSFDRCVAVGFAGDTALPERAVNVADSYNGQSWTADAIPTNTDGGVNGVSCPTAGYCMAVGDALGPNGFVPDSYVLRGTIWSAQPVPNSDGTTASSGLASVSCTAVALCVAVGSQTRTSGNASSTILTAKGLDGRGWTPQTIQQPALPQAEFAGVS